MTRKLFVTGTDTDSGKTVISVALLSKLEQANRSAIGFKPVSAGCENTAEGLRNADALALQKHSGLAVSYQQVNPIAFEPPVAPHLVAEQIGQPIDLKQLNAHYQQLLELQPQVLVTEGAGGWRLPLGGDTFLSDFAVQHNMQVILVVGMKLGCLNHALLTAEAIRRDNLSIVGWVANQVDANMALVQDNLNYLKQALAAPCLGYIPWLTDTLQARDYIDLPK
jgi:dethiobiotin synthetase